MLRQSHREVHERLGNSGSHQQRRPATGIEINGGRGLKTSLYLAFYLFNNRPSVFLSLLAFLQSSRRNPFYRPALVLLVVDFAEQNIHYLQS